MAILRVFIDTGARRAEVVGLPCTQDDDNDVDLDNGLLRVMGKGGRALVLPIGHKTVKALDRYLRKRGQYAGKALSYLWLGRKGLFAETGVAQMIKNRGGAPDWAKSIRTTCDTPSRTAGFRTAALRLT